jgi:hypothetical protein
MDSAGLTGLVPKAESFFDSVGSVPNQSPNRFDGWFDSACYLLGQFAWLISTRTGFKN